MTRINAGIPPKLLSNKHLLAEHREIKRIPNNIVKRLKLFKQINLGPNTFTLGEGHINFFNNKVAYLHKRYVELREECIARGFKVTSYEDAFFSAHQWAPHLYNDWRPCKSDISIIIDRLVERDLYYVTPTFNAQRLWREQMAEVVIQLKTIDPELYNHIKTIKK